MPNKSFESQRLIDYLIEIRQSQCSITYETVKAEADEAMAAVLLGILYMYEDLQSGSQELRTLNEELGERVTELKQAEEALKAS